MSPCCQNPTAAAGRTLAEGSLAGHRYGPGSTDAFSIGKHGDALVGTAGSLCSDGFAMVQHKPRDRLRLLRSSSTHLRILWSPDGFPKESGQATSI